MVPFVYKIFHFTPSSEFNAYLKQIKGILSAVKYIVFFSPVKIWVNDCPWTYHQ